MIRASIPVLLLAAACSKSPGDKGATGLPGGDKMAVEKISVGEPKGPTPPQGDNPKLHLKPEEGTLEVGKIEGAAGTAATARVTMKTTSSYHVAKEYPVELELEPPAEIKLAKADLTAGGSAQVQGDAVTYEAKSLAFEVTATAQKPGNYEIKGTFNFAVCAEAGTQCFAKVQPISISVAAK